ncbi:MAG: AI-2E family transporter [Desulfuromonadales bacterium]|nr:AI-2E family transporter [Desulfuromonadales bacterium]
MSPSLHGVHRSDYGKLIAAILLLCLVAASGYALQHTISCFLLSWVIAYLLDPLLMRAEQHAIKRMRALVLLYGVIGVLSIFFIAIIVPKLTMGWDGFVRDLPVYIQKIKQIALGWKTRVPVRYGSEEIQWLIDKALDNVDTAAQQAGVMAYSFSSKIFFNIFNILLSPILVFFMLYYKRTIIDTLKTLLPAQHSAIIIDIGLEVNSSIGGYLRGQVIVSIIVAILSTVALLILDVPHPIFCGIFAGAASILPFIGILIAILPALFFTWFKYQTITALTQTGIAFGAIYFLEGYIIKPLIFKEAMNINPLMTIIMVMALGELLGFWGILLALPIAAAIRITWDHVIRGDFKH